MEKRISGHTGLLALIGSPVGHSGSPAMYNYSFEKLGLDYAYVAFDIKEDKVKDAIAAMKTFSFIVQYVNLRPFRVHRHGEKAPVAGAVTG